ncbi:hypothetical protein [Luethyella okanaganae]|uniref:Right handed beta helix domain-containing protein n=1 Tax=Luethyella okanaganae TaxID=69372 RepID=A0ABW1VHX2_9MICO
MTNTMGIFAGAVVGLGLLTAQAAPPASAETTPTGITYYVDSAGGDDARDGRSEGSAWASLAKVNATTFASGDAILFRSGASWTGQLHPKGSGEEGRPITIGKYGQGAAPKLEGHGNVESVVYLFNQQHWDIGYLEVTNRGTASATAPRRGVHILGQDYQVGASTNLSKVSTLKGIRIHDLDIHDVNGEDKKDGDGSAGIQVSVKVPGMNAQGIPPTNTVRQRTSYDSVTIENNVIDKVSRSGIITWTDWQNRAELGDGLGYGESSITPFTPMTNVVIRGNRLTQIGGDGIVPHQTVDALVERNTIAGFNVTSQGYNVGMWTWNGDRTLYQFNEVSGGKTTMDGNAFDFDHGSRGVIYQYNYSHDNEGGTLLLCADGRATGGGIYDGVFRYNVSQNDRHQLFSVCGGANLYNMKVYNNTFYIAPGLSTKVFQAGGGANQVAFNNNIFYNLGSGGYAAKPSWTYDHNVYFGNNTPSTSVIPDANGSTADPLLENPGNATGIGDLNGYRLTTGSPALRSGVVVTGPGAKDLWGHPANPARPNRGAHAGPGTHPSPRKG